ncbi:hypothetical protein LSH36_600g01076 [Paralvinella palmiformis]|uniref:Cold shock domain-containing protein E1 n=1 Tax=Paralvinella palmiformis TaxID=53620 RepID=A0AAD9J5Q5_9ANNE|nr:hypothetical protein LSH36_600g01076 [Paralvinella palmiformis]
MSITSPQWKNYQGPVQDPAILAFQHSPGVTNFVGPTMIPGVQSSNSIRETGIIEKMLHTYGFIQCCDREARLFFHFTEYNEDIETMKIGDPVEFQMSFDRRTGKPIAVSVTRLEVLNENRVSGVVVTEAKPTGKPKAATGCGNQDGLGRVSYEQSGEVFFLPFSVDDVEDGSRLQTGDDVTFYIATNKRNGSVRACKVKSITAPKQGVVCSMKDNYGFIERADVVKEIFFHYSGYQGDITELVLGDDVEFNIQMRNGKEVAVNIKKLAEGTVIFDDVAVEKRRGKILKTLKSPHGRRQSDPLAGRIVYETVKGPIEIPYGDKDQKGEYTLQQGDLVEFNIATDRRDKLQRATNILLVDDTFKISSEVRETGIVTTLKDGYGFIRCMERDASMFFRFSELLNQEKEVKVQDEVRFTVAKDPTSPTRNTATRILFLPKGTVVFEKILPKRCTGTVEKEPTNKGKDSDPGIIMYDVNGTKQTIPYHLKSVQGAAPKCGDKVEFQICESSKNSIKNAVSIRTLSTNGAAKQYGFIATLKDSFGFIEMADHEKEVFFHFSALEGEPGDLDLGDEVEFHFAHKTNKVSAENIRKVARGSVAPEEVLPGVLDGKIIRCMRIINPDQDEYPGLVQVGKEEDEDISTKQVYPYGITSLSDKKDFLQKGDIVKFQIAVMKDSGKTRATNIAAVRKYIHAKVDSIKGHFGFLNYEAEEGKKLFFHMTEVHGDAELHPGDRVQFVVVKNQRNGKYSACSLRKIIEREHKRPDRLLSRIKSINLDDTQPKVVTLRQPKGPDGSKGFKERVLWKPE